LVERLALQNDNKILLVVLDGLGGLPVNGRTELETASKPNLDRLAAKSGLGMHTPVDIGVTPGSGPAHLGLFGYDPVLYEVGRGVVEALGVGLHPAPTDLCARANFATIGPDGRLSDRRAGRIPTEKCAELCSSIQQAIPSVEDVAVVVKPGREHRFVVVLRGAGLESGLTDSDPQHEGLAPSPVKPLRAEAAKSARIANSFVSLCQKLLASEPAANYVLLRGLDRPPHIPSMQERFKLRPACVAVYPMYKGLARFVGMDVIEAGETWESEVAALRENMPKYDFLFVHFKDTDKAGEDGDFDRKVELIERFDEEVVPQLLRLKPDVFCLTGDHSTPATLKGHSWHSVPFLLNSPYVRRHAALEEFGERACSRGTFGCRLPARQLMNLLLAHSLKLQKFGA